MASELVQFIIEFLCNVCEELHDDSAGGATGSGAKVSPFGLLSVTPSHLAYKHVREGRAWDVALSLLGENFLYF